METEEFKKPLPIGESFFDKVIEDGYYYIDKTLFIRDLLDKRAAVTLCTRPRRFGKTLNQMMLKCFFEDTKPLGGKDTRALFDGLNIESAGDRYMKHQGQYPVIYMSFAGVESNNYASNADNFKRVISEEFRRHRYVMEKIDNDDDLNDYRKLCSKDESVSIFEQSLKFLCKCLEKYHGKKVVILIDEYDVPLQRAWLTKHYDEMINFIRPFMKDAFKDNPHLQFAVITGCLRVSKESIFTGLNNLAVVSIRGKEYSEHFGFTQDEIDPLLEYYGLAGKRELLREWYNGYLFGNTVVYNPWSSINIVSDWREDADELPKPYWGNTSGNDIVRKLIDKASGAMKDELETLMAGGTINKQVREDVVYGDIENDADNLWNFLFFTGYLKQAGVESADYAGRIYIDMKIPNKEVNLIYVNNIQEWFNERIQEKDLTVFYRAILEGDVATFQTELNKLLLESISYMDSAEDFYHGYMAGLLQRFSGYGLKSNRESGHGRSDLALYSKSELKVIIFEFKSAPKADLLPAACKEALAQIEDNNYAAEWINDGYSAADIQKYGIGFCKKKCMVTV